MMNKKLSKLPLLIAVIAIFLFGIFFQKCLFGLGVNYSWLITIAIMTFLGYLADKKLKNK